MECKPDCEQCKFCDEIFLAWLLLNTDLGIRHTDTSNESPVARSFPEKRDARYKKTNPRKHKYANPDDYGSARQRATLAARCRVRAEKATRKKDVYVLKAQLAAFPPDASAARKKQRALLSKQKQPTQPYKHHKANLRRDLAEIRWELQNDKADVLQQKKTERNLYDYMW